MKQARLLITTPLEVQFTPFKTFIIPMFSIYAQTVPDFSQTLLEKGFIFALLGIAIVYLVGEVKALKSDVAKLQAEQVTRLEKDTVAQNVMIARCAAALDEVVDLMHALKDLFPLSQLKEKRDPSQSKKD